MTLSVFDFIVLALATWRIAYMLVKEDGPWAVFARLRTRAGLHQIVIQNGAQTDIAWAADNTLAEGLQCVWCVSIWIATLFSLTLLVPVLQLPVLWLGRLCALSACAIIVNELVAGNRD